MKTRFSTLDIVAAIPEIQQKLAGMRVVNCYDIDNKTYLIKLQKPDFKGTILFESGNRLHMTEFEWPKNFTPSGFAMKLRKHLRGRRLEKIEQLGIDRIVDMQFGSGEAAYHIILELYDRGNIVLTDFEYTILNILRPRTDDSQDVRFAVREKYPLDTARQPEGVITEERLRAILLSAKEGENLRKVLNPHLVYGPALLDHALRGVGLQDSAQIGKTFSLTDGVQLQQLLAALQEAESFLQICKHQPCKGILIQKKEKKVDSSSEEDVLMTNIEFHPALFRQHETSPIKEFETFNQAVDEFFSQIGTQKLDVKALQQEKSAIKKLENVKRDHVKRLDALQREQELDTRKGQLIEMNLPLVDRAITIVRSAVANQIDWTEIQGIVKEAQSQGDQVAETIKGLKLDTNHMTLLLRDTYLDEDEDGGKPIKIDIDLGLSAYANARKYFDMKRTAAKKEQKTIDASSKALKSAEKKTKQTLKDVATSVKINKARKTYWFEKFLWFISSENYLVIGGRDQQQNEILVKRYLRPGDLYVHADLHGASSVLLKNPSGEPVPPKTLNEAGTMAVCNSAAWDAKVVTSAWWVGHQQVSKTAPTGEYLTTGSFMIRGKKNFLPPCYLIYGFAFLFKLDEDSIERHRDERKVRVAEEGDSEAGDSASQVSELQDLDDGSMDLEDGSDGSDEDEEGASLPVIAEDVQLSTEVNSPPVGVNNVTVDIKTEEDLNVTDVLSTKCERTDTSDKSPESETVISKDTGTSIEEDDSCDIMEDKKSVIVKKESDSEEDVEFPDTAISLQHVEGDKFTLQRHPSQSTTSVTEEDRLKEAEDFGDGKKGGRLSAKQRRQMKKKGQIPSVTNTLSETTSDTTCDQAEKTTSKNEKQEEKETSETQVQFQPKRRQKAKQKKMKAKYHDQDEEERQLRMEILASAGEKKEDKKKGKKNKQKQQQQQQAKQRQQANQQDGKPGTKEGPFLDPKESPGRDPKEGQGRDPRKPSGLEAAMEGVKIEDKVKAGEEVETGTPAPEDDHEEEEQPQGSEDAQALQSLTGQPHQEDTLLFCMPVCAPYSALLNYKYKVKLIPGSTKRGKAAKLAHHMFVHDRTATPAEKDLLRVIKDDMSRNIPGKVKVAAQGISKVKTKTKK